MSNEPSSTTSAEQQGKTIATQFFIATLTGNVKQLEVLKKSELSAIADNASLAITSSQSGTQAAYPPPVFRR